MGFSEHLTGIPTMPYSRPMTNDMMTFEDFENEAEREEREAAQAGLVEPVDSDYEYGYSMAEREEVEVDSLLDSLRHQKIWGLSDLLNTNPWDVEPHAWHHDPYDF